jgi:hypothetical protein
MADGVEITAGTGTEISTDDCGAAGHTQIVKLAIATDGSATLVPADATDGMLVNLGANNDMTVTGNVAVTHTALTELAAAIDTEVQVDVVTSALPSGASTAAKQPALGTAGTASADVISVQGIASMTPLQVGDNSGSLTVDAPVGTPVFVRLSDGSSAITTLPVSLASVPSHAVTNAGTFAVQETGTPIINKHVSTSATLVANTNTNPTLTVSGFTAKEIEVTNVTGAAAIYITLDNSTPSSTNFIAALPATPCSVTLPMNATPTLRLISTGTPVYAATVRGA